MALYGLYFAACCVALFIACVDSQRSVRLVGGRAVVGEGRLEVQWNRLWIGFCDDGFDNNSVQVACYELGYGYNGYVKGNGALSHGRCLRNVRCSGSEASLAACLDRQRVSLAAEADVSYVSVSCIAPPVVNPIAAWSDAGCGVSKYNDAGKLGGDSLALVVGGHSVREHEYPWQISLMLKLRTPPYRVHLCGGSVINRRWILTAAHCLYDEFRRRWLKSALAVVVGHHDHSAASSVRQTFNVRTIAEHHDFSWLNYRHDIALLKVHSDIVFSEDVQPICPPNSTDQYAGWKAYVSGWGRLDATDYDYPDILQHTSIHITSNRYCQMHWRRRQYDIFSSMVCASGIEDSVDVCRGDSGGPLAVKDGAGRFHIVGIVSFGNFCSTDMPSVYTRVSSHFDWIYRTISEGDTNLASKKSAVQSSTHATSVAGLAVDNNSQTESCTRRTANPWWQVDLGAYYYIDTVTITNSRHRAHHQRLGLVTLSLSNFAATVSPPTWLNYSIRCAQYPVHTVAPSATISLACPFTAPPVRYVTLQGHSRDNAICLTEVEVFARSSLDQPTHTLNVARNRPAVQQSTLSAMTAANAVDGLNTTMSCTGEPYMSNPWWQVDLGHTVRVGTVSVKRHDCHVCEDDKIRLDGFTVSLSNVPATESPPTWLDYPTPCGRYIGSVAIGATAYVACPSTLPAARYVTVQGSGDILCLLEVEVFAR